MPTSYRVIFGSSLEGTVLSAAVSAETPAQAVNAACEAIWGKGTWFCRDHSAATCLRGQVCVSNVFGTHRALTEPVIVTVIGPGKKEVDVIGSVPFNAPIFRAEGHRRFRPQEPGRN